ncbi:hypothetical protein EDB87DRAFT_336071 [Lactarius vividus]|nr:hypothetical protein EDB87DRAFT_336071 [Lactarius vividus]
MTNEEARMASAEALKVAYNIIKEVKVVEEKVQMVIDSGKETAMEAKMTMQQTAHNLDDVKRSSSFPSSPMVEYLTRSQGGNYESSLKKWHSPPDPSTNHELTCECRHEGTAKWFCQGSLFEEWKVAGSLLWIHGKPGSGKSILCSAIIQNIITLSDAGSASIAYFYFDFRNIDKRSLRNLLPSLLVQLSAGSNAFCDVLARLYETHDDGESTQ